MRLEDLVLVSVDDHVVEPPDLFEGRLAGEVHADVAPKLVRKDSGIDVWQFMGAELPNIGLNAVAGRPPEEYAMDPQSFDDMRTGCYDIHDRVKDMNANGMLGSMCFPSFPQFCGQLFARAAQKDEPLATALVQAYNDWHIESWCGAYPGRFIPLAIPMMWDVDKMAAEVRRVADKGCHAVTFSENPVHLGLPEHPLRPLGPVLRDVRGARHGRERAHRLVVEDGDHRRRRADGRAHHALADQHRAGRGRLRVVDGAGEVPEAEVRAQRGRHRLDSLLPRAHRLHVRPPPLLDRPGHGRPHAEPGARRAGHLLLDRRPGRRRHAAQDEHRHDLLGVRLPALRLDVAAVARAVWKQMQASHCSDEDIDKITHANAMRLYNYDPFSMLGGRENCTVGALRAAGRRLGREHRGAAASRPAAPARSTCSTSPKPNR